MWVVYLNALLALALAIFIVWWTMGGHLRSRKPPQDGSADPPHDGGDGSGDGGGPPPR